MADENVFERFTSDGKSKGKKKNDIKMPKGIGKIMFAVVAVIVLAILVSQSTYTIREQEQAVLVTFGKAEAVTEAGLHFKIPFIQQVKKVNTTIQGFSIGYASETNATTEDESLMITSDYNFVNVDFFVEYRVSDPVKALYASEEPVEILKKISQSCIRNVIGSYEVDSVLTTGKNEIQSQIKEMIVQKLEERDIGIQLVNITIQDAEPPTEAVMQAFKAVETAKQESETAVNNANKYRNEQIPAAQAEADRIVQEAEADKTERINEATAQVARFDAMYAEYVKYPELTQQRMFYETMEEVLPDLTVIIESGNGETQTVVPVAPLFGNITSSPYTTGNNEG